MKRVPKSLIGSILELAGAACIVGGVALVSASAGLIVCGLLLIFVARGVAK